MKRDFRYTIILLAFSLPVLAALFIGTIYLVNCGVNNNCFRGDLAPVIHTPVPTLFPVSLSTATPAQPNLQSSTPCSAPARILLQSWVSAGAQQNQPFTYNDSSGNACLTGYEDIQPLFTQAGLWYPGALACTECHNQDLSTASAGLDLTSYAGISAGAERSGASPTGIDILGGGNWGSAILNQVLFMQKSMPPGAPAGLLTGTGPMIQAGQPQVTPPVYTPTPPGYEEIAEPSNPGPPGQAVTLTGDAKNGATLFVTNCAICHGDQGKGGIPNQGSSDGTVPPLNPIDPTLKNPVYMTFATNIDLFIQNGSVPEGQSPLKTMPAWGVSGDLTQQQIADIIAYVISLNP